jgi:protein disulfide-isomerase A1
LRPIVSEIDISSLPDFVGLDDIVFTAEFIPDDLGLYERGYRNLAKQYYDRFSFAILPLARHHSSITCRNNVDGEEFTLIELSNVQALEELVTKCTRPLILEPTRKEIAELGQIASQSGKSIMVHYFASTDQEKSAYRQEVAPLAKQLSKALQFTIIDSNEHPMMPVATGLKKGTKSGLVIENIRNGDLFPYTGNAEMSAMVLDQFLNDILEGRITPWNGLRDGELLHDEL